MQKQERRKKQESGKFLKGGAKVFCKIVSKQPVKRYHGMRMNS